MKKSHQAFTLIETMVAITILTLSIVGPMLAADRAIVAANIAQDQLTASYLAQEGIEYVRGIRDDQFLLTYPDNTTQAWNKFLNVSPSPVIPCEVASLPATNACTLDALQNSLTQCTIGSTCKPLYVTGGVYTQTPGSNGVGVTPFTRTIQLTSINSNDEQVISTVSWTFHGTQYTVSITDDLTPWQ